MKICWITIVFSSIVLIVLLNKTGCNLSERVLKCCEWQTDLIQLSVVGQNVTCMILFLVFSNYLYMQIKSQCTMIHGFMSCFQRNFVILLKTRNCFWQLCFLKVCFSTLFYFSCFKHKRSKIILDFFEIRTQMLLQKNTYIVRIA